MEEAFYKHLIDPPKKYRPIPFWSWNERLSVQETRRQIALMDEAGIGGYFMHARGGLQTPYMGREWMENIAAGVDEADARGMGAWAYDENGWPSGFGDGIVNGKGEKFQQKYLRYEFCGAAQKRADGRTIGNVHLKDGRVMHFYYDVNPFYVDTLDGEVTQAFLDEIYAPYVARFKRDIGKAMPGFFTDEPQVSRDGIPWSLTIQEKYREYFGEDLLPLLPGLFLPEGNYKKTRYRFWYLVQELFVIHFTQKIFHWCSERGAGLTGHMVLEETLLSQLTSNGAVMPHYEFFHVPGMDWLGRLINPPTTTLQVSSVCHQLGKKQILSETFALTGWNVSFEELKWIYEWQMVRGVTLLCQHLEGYSLRGIRKRDYPPSLFFQQPWWEHYRGFNDAMSRIGMLLSEGDVRFSTLVLHPQSSAWLCFDNQSNPGIESLNGQFLEVIRRLEEAHVPFHLGDERILKRHGKAEGKTLTVGLQNYRAVVVPPCETLAQSTVDLLLSFARGGGTLIFIGQTPSLVEGEPSDALGGLVEKGRRVSAPDQLADRLPGAMTPVSIKDANGARASEISFTFRGFSAGEKELRFYYFVNSDTEKDIDARIEIPEKAAWLFDPEDGSIAALSKGADGALHHALPRMGSLALFASDDPRALSAPDQKAADPLPLESGLFEGKWTIAETEANALTLDRCDFWFDGVLQAENEHVGVIQARACGLEKPVRIRMRFDVRVAEGFTPGEDICLVLETPEIYRIALNGRAVPNTDCGCYRDASFRKIPIGGLLTPGKNELILETDFAQDKNVYRQLKRARVFEAEKNKLTYDREIECAYIVGNFSVGTPGVFTALNRDAMRYSGEFIIAPPITEASIGDLTKQGLPFYNGSIRLKKRITLGEDEIRARCFRLKKRMATVVSLRVNGQPAAKWRWRPYQADLEGLLQPGENEIELELTGNLRNLLGPHHLREGESYAVAPSCFFKEPNVWGNRPWSDDYCFVSFGAEI